jgi:hypothetical protein
VEREFREIGNPSQDQGGNGQKQGHQEDPSILADCPEPRNEDSGKKDIRQDGQSDNAFHGGTKRHHEDDGKEEEEKPPDTDSPKSYVGLFGHDEIFTSSYL